MENFYARLFSEMPHMRALFPAEMGELQDKFVSMLAFLVDRLDTPERFASECASLGVRHQGYGAHPAMYQGLGNILVDSISNLPDGPMSAMEVVLWKRMYGLISGFMVAVPPGRP